MGFYCKQEDAAPDKTGAAFMPLVIMYPVTFSQNMRKSSSRDITL